MNVDNSLISHIAELSLLLGSLKSRYESVIDIIEEEHENVRYSRLEKLELLTLKKIELGDLIKSETQSLFTIFRKVRELMCSSCSGQSPDPVDLSELVEQLKALEITDTLEGKVFDFEIGKLSSALLEFKNIKKKYQPKVEMNRYVINKALKNHRETFCFWQSIASESESIYGSKGVAKSKPLDPILRVKT